MKAVLSAAVVVIALAQPSHAFTAKNRMTVTQIDATDFMVEYDNVPRGTDYLCAAGDYVIRGLGLPSNTRLFRASPPPRQQGQGIRFTMAPTRKVKMGLFTSYGKEPTDGGISAGVATGTYCEMIKWFPFD